MALMRQIRQAAAKLNDAGSILLTTHENPDADALGSLLALARVLRAMQKEVYCLISGIVNRRFPRIFPELKDINIDDCTAIPRCTSCLVVVDAPNRKRCPKFIHNFSTKTIINIDHHKDNLLFGHINIVEARAASSAELVYLLLQKMQTKIDTNTAEYLYCGIVADTFSFSYSATSAVTHQIAAQLLSLGANPEKVSRELIRRKTRKELKLQKIIIENLKFYCNYEICGVLLSVKLCKQANAAMRDIDDFASLPRDIEGVSVGVFAREYRNEVRFSLRSEYALDVGEFCHKYGGGGHAKAAGCRIAIKNQTSQQIFTDFMRNLQQYFLQYEGKSHIAD